MILPTLMSALILTVVPPPRPPAEPPVPVTPSRLLLTVTDAQGPRAGVALQLLRSGIGGRVLPLPGRPLRVLSSTDGTATLPLNQGSALLVQISDPERNVLLRFPLNGAAVLRIGTTTFQLQIVAAGSVH